MKGLTHDECIMHLLVIRGTICGVHLRSLWVSRAGAVGVREQALDGGEQCADGVARRPSILDDVHAQRAVAVDCAHDTRATKGKR